VNDVAALVSAGIMYKAGNLRVGFSLPSMLSQRPFVQSESYTQQLEPFQDWMFTASYRLEGSTLAFEPTLLYRKTQEMQDRIEATGVVYWQNRLWGGAAYLHDQGISAIAGLRLLKLMSVGYVYTMPTGSANLVANSNHEFMIGIRFGAEKPLKREKQPYNVSKKYKPQPTAIRKPAPTQRKPAAKPKEVAKKEPPVEKINADSAVLKQASTPVTDINSNKADSVISTPSGKQEVIQAVDNGSPLEIKRGYYVVVGSFRQRQNAINYLAKPKQSGFKSADFKYSSKTKYNYVYVVRASNKEDAQITLAILRQTKGFEDTWVNTLIVE